VTAKSVARKSKARTDKSSVAATTASPPAAEVQPAVETTLAAEAKSKPARASRKVKQEAALLVDTTVPAEPVKPVATRKRRMAREPEAAASVVVASDAHVAEPVADGTSPRKRSATKAKSTSPAEAEATESKAVKPVKVKAAAAKTGKAKVADPKPAATPGAVLAPAGRSKGKKSAAKAVAPAAQEA